ncbi:MAG: hypothetical protein KKC41_08085 [Actinobacteria bacterium]|nr:hypothetical protein [Actinomycetota bacterium]MBU4206220.1 hypothetical protein [Actinomycetota bacterium]MBU4588179.1 hypothetical protein [Actinomycetota bacterium]
MSAALLAVLLITAMLTSGCTGDSSVPPVKVLFIGNSYTAYNGGIDAALRGLAPRISVGSVAPGGYTLRQHLADPTTMDTLDDGWDYIVLQEQSQKPVYDYADYLDSARQLTKRIRELNGNPRLLMTWARPDSARVTTEALRRTTSSVANKLGLSVIPAGTAFADSARANPAIILNGPDGHPTREGTYLAACAAFAQLFGRTPVGNTYTAGLDAGVAKSLQQAAARAAGR